MLNKVLCINMNDAIKTSMLIIVISLTLAIIVSARKEKDDLLKRFLFVCAYALFFGCILLGALIYNLGFAFLMSVVGFIIAIFITKKLINRKVR